MNLNHVRRGDGDPLVLLHSLGGTVRLWSPVLERLAERREVIAVDMPGFGDSPSLPSGTPATAANLAVAVVDHLGSLGLDSKPGMAGISLGAWVAIECARGGAASAVVGISSAGFWKEPLEERRPTAHMAARLMRPLVPLLMRSPGIRHRALAGNFHHPERVPVTDAIALIRGYGGGRAYPEASRLMRADVVGDLNELDVPLTLAWAEFDRGVRNRPLPDGVLPDWVRQVLLPDCGHIPTWDAPELVTRVILEGTVRRKSST